MNNFCSFSYFGRKVFIYIEKLYDLCYNNTSKGGVAMKENLMVDNMAFRSFSSDDWRTRLPQPICEDVPDYDKLYQKAWELSYDHIRYIDGMPKSPYMDEAFCDTQLWIGDTCFMSLFCKYTRDDFPGMESLRNFLVLNQP